MNNALLSKALLTFTGIAAAIVIVIVLRSGEQFPADEQERPTGRATNRTPSEPVMAEPAGPTAGRPSDPEIQPVQLPPVQKPDAPPSPTFVDETAPEDVERTPDGEKIYTMDTLPTEISGIYRVRDAEGRVNRIAVDIPGPDSPVGELE